jgi:sodium transport system ATP-binding protein
MGGMKALIEVEGLSKIYQASDDGRPVIALQEASFIARPGRVFGLIGANGAGKTTTLRILSTVLKPSAGKARVCGFDVIENPDEIRRRIGFLSGSTGVYDRMTPIEFIDYFGVLSGLDPETLEKRRNELLELLDMKSFANRYCGVLSTGQKQKVSIARALIHDPPVLIFDEPTSGLDILVARTVINFVESLKSKDRTIILSTHIMSEADQLCDDMAIIHEGRVLVCDSVAALKERFEQTSIQGIFYHLIDARQKVVT